MKSHHKKNTSHKASNITEESVDENMSADPEIAIDVEEDLDHSNGIYRILTPTMQYRLSIVAFSSVILIALLLLFVFVTNL